MQENNTLFIYFSKNIFKNIFFIYIFLLFFILFYFILFIYLFRVGCLSAHPIWDLGWQPSLSRAGLSAQIDMGLRPRHILGLDRRPRRYWTMASAHDSLGLGSHLCGLEPKSFGVFGPGKSPAHPYSGPARMQGDIIRPLHAAARGRR